MADDQNPSTSDGASTSEAAATKGKAPVFKDKKEQLKYYIAEKLLVFANEIFVEAGVDFPFLMADLKEAIKLVPAEILISYFGMVEGLVGTYIEDEDPKKRLIGMVKIALLALKADDAFQLLAKVTKLLATMDENKELMMKIYVTIGVIDKIIKAAVQEGQNAARAAATAQRKK